MQLADDDRMHLRDWAISVLDDLAAELEDEQSELSQDLAACKNSHVFVYGTQTLGNILTHRRSAAAHPPSLSSYSQELAVCIDTAYRQMKASVGAPSVLFGWRRFYTEASLISSLMDCVLVVHSDSSFWFHAIARLDHAIVITGAPGRLDLIHLTIEKIQDTHLPLQDHKSSVAIDLALNHNASLASSPLVNASQHVPSLASPPTFSSFQKKLSLSPFVLRQAASHWPAIDSSSANVERLWSSKRYLRQVAGRGRVVPVEIGSDYRTDSWTQQMMDWEEFLDRVFPDTNNSANSFPAPARGQPREMEEQQDVTYLAQYDLFKQFPALSSDIIVPDYVYASLPAPECFPKYKPPSNTEALVINAWLGPAGTVSPAHTDPFFNFYVQVVGYKTVWLAPPSTTGAMSPFAPLSSPSNSDAVNSNNHPALNQENPSMSNTSQLDAFDPSLSNDDDDGDGGEWEGSDASRKAFRDHVLPHAMSVLLGPGDMLFFPPGWWHAMRSESTSFSVSMWF